MTGESSTGPPTQPQDDTSANVIRDTPYPTDVETGAEAGMSDNEGDTKILNVDEEKAGSNPEQSHVALAGPNPEPMHEDFIATVYLKVHESLKHTTKENFLNDKPTEEELGKANVEAEVESMVTVSIHQSTSLISPFSTPVIDLTQPKPVSSPIQEPIFTTTTTTLLPPLPPQQQGNIDPALATRVSAL
ncbi:hypothetical protein Tco_0845457, partial [Tanacetum coccineum]